VRAVDGEVDDLGDEPVGPRGVAAQQSVVERPAEQVEGGVDRRAGAQVALGDGAVEDNPCLLAAGSDQAGHAFLQDRLP